MVLFFMHIPFVVNHTINATGEVVTLYITVAFGGHFESGIGCLWSGSQDWC